MNKKIAITKAGFNLDNSYARLPDVFYSRVKPSPVRLPEPAIINDGLALDLGLDAGWLQSDEGLQILAGNVVPKGSVPIAQAYAGHQFGHFTMLGDGRAVLLGEHGTISGERVDIQLKGSGKTPYSRGGDGRAALGPMLREYIISEAMHGLGIPTTRSLAVVTTGEKVIREVGLPGAILTRVASSHLRVGTFQYAAAKGALADLKILADYTIKRHFPTVSDDENPYFSLLKEVIKRQARLISKWQLAGFIHGVMNTDNMALSGETIDYGPCAFMDTYMLKTVFSSIDRQGRYSYGNQPTIGQWNLARFAETLLPLLNENDEKAIAMATEAVKGYEGIYLDSWTDGMRAKLGICNKEDNDKGLIDELLMIMEETHADYTNTFLALTFDDVAGTTLFESERFRSWYDKWLLRLGKQDESMEESKQLMRDNNPSLIPRNHQVEIALEKAEQDGDYTLIKELQKAVSMPFAHLPWQARYSKPAPPSDLPYKTFCGT